MWLEAAEGSGLPMVCVWTVTARLYRYYDRLLLPYHFDYLVPFRVSIRFFFAMEVCVLEMVKTVQRGSRRSYITSACVLACASNTYTET